MMAEEQLLFSMVFLVVVSLVAFAWYFTHYSAYRSREGMGALAKRWLSPKGLATIALTACLVMAASAVVELVERLAIPDYYASYIGLVGETAGYPGWYLVFGVCLLAPLSEELVFRGVLLHAVQRAGLPMVVAIVAQAALFAVLHGSLFQVIYAFVVGVFLGWICYETRSIVPVAIIHICNNVVSMVLAGQSEIVNGIVLGAFALASVAWVVLVVRGTLSLEPASMPGQKAEK